MQHTCDALVVTCIDFRFQDYIDAWTKQNMPPHSHDRVALAGGVFDLGTILGQVDVSKRLHDIKKVVLINHEDCGAYGKEETHDRHIQDLHKASQAVKEKYPDVVVETCFLHLDGKFEKGE